MNRSIVKDLFSNETLSLMKNNGRFFREGNLIRKEFSVLDTYEIKKMGNGFRYMILKTAHTGQIPVKHVSRLVNTLFLIYGEDDYGRGKFSDLDIITLHSPEVYWHGRSWLTDGKYMHPAMIRYDDQEGLRLFVMNV